MTVLKKWLKLRYSLKDKKLQWREANQHREDALKHAHALSEEALAAELKKKSEQLNHDIRLLKTQHNAELSMFKTKCKQDIKDYKQYLASLDQLKSSIQASYTHLPEAVAFTIHHHAKQLLNTMWEAEDIEQKMQHEMQLIRFMTTVHEDARLYLEGKSADNLPERTLDLIGRR
ncbi:MAG: hypothetical protein Q7U38_11815 [Methylobacter sp.]|nr:hypothetical protein [Methylobacter sp.]MDP2098721.1 hypothetical protein [Methylobacter sp.]MDP2429538.1 hypothetical protein [Methylobacter sp.]MDP3054627.1 hypothetical protein [Methylobacter sp.]MDP3363404.1 hypothetical protein [Methylobacter sp.]